MIKNKSFYDKELHRDIVILYSPPKVGSTTIVSSIRLSASDKFIVFHTHKKKILETTVSGEKIELNIDDLKSNVKYYIEKKIMVRNIYIIDIFRTDVERKMSEYFQYLCNFHFNNLDINMSDYPVEKLIKRFNDIYLHDNGGDYYNNHYGIDKISKFDFEKKYHVYKQDNITYLKLRLEDSEHWGKILSEILDTPIKMINDYSTNDKKISLLYRKFKEMYKLPFNYFKDLIHSQELKIYLTMDEQKKYLDSWKIKTTNPYNGFTNEQYLFYTMITLENKYYKDMSNEHYFDDGCLCNCCIRKRKIVNKLVEIKNNYKIKHKYDDNYHNPVLLNLNNQIVIINNFNYY